MNRRYNNLQVRKHKLSSMGEILSKADPRDSLRELRAENIRIKKEHAKSITQIQQYDYEVKVLQYDNAILRESICDMYCILEMIDGKLDVHTNMEYRDRYKDRAVDLCHDTLDRLYGLRAFVEWSRCDSSAWEVLSSDINCEWMDDKKEREYINKILLYAVEKCKMFISTTKV